MGGRGGGAAARDRGGGGTSEPLTVAFTSAAGAELLAGATLLFNDQLPDCEVRLREAAPGQLAGWLRSGEADLGLTALPVREPGIAGGPVLVREARLLAVPLGTASPAGKAPRPATWAASTWWSTKGPSTGRSRWPEPAGAPSLSARTPAATTPGPTSPTSPLATPRRWSGA